MDNYTVHLTQNGKQQEITAYVDGLSMRDDGDAYSAELSFTVAVNPYDPFLKDLKIEAKDNITLKNGDKTIFSGFVIRRTKAGEVECRDNGFYLKSDITCQFNGTDAANALNTVCKKAGIQYGWYSIPSVSITGDYARTQASSVIDSILEQMENETGKRFIHRMIDNKLCVRAFDENVITVTYTRPVSKPLNITWAVGEVEVSSTMEDMATNIVVQTDENDTTVTLATATDPDAVTKYGYMTKMLSVDSDKKGTAVTVLNNAIKECATPTTQASVGKIWGSDAVIPGKLLLFGSDKFGLSGKWWVTSVTHTYQPYHYMSLELLAYETPKSNMKVVITPQAANTDGTSSGTTTTTKKTKLGNFKLTFYAGDTSTASGKKPAVGRTIATDPSVIPLGTRVYIEGWGERTAEDTGGAIKGKKIDIFVASNAEARKYGVQYADVYKIETVTTSVSSGSAGGSAAGRKLVQIALAEEGYRETGRDHTKYGKWFGMDGNYWCAMFVAWCANQAGISTSVIPKLASVSGYMNWYKERGKFHTTGTGYRPQVGDLMIQKSAGASHIGIVVSSTASGFTTIEGNSSNRVAQRSYSYTDAKLTGFCSPF
ncbi:MAG: 3D domain-containing protein [Eubacteriales bacterium]|nr:3D domain-containing protein [Eubacteriales bacterium]